MRRIAIALALLTFPALAQPQRSVCGVPGINECYAPNRAQAFGIASSGTTSLALPLTIPAGRWLRSIEIFNTTANAITGNLNIGTTASGADIASSCPIAANAIVVLTPGAAATAHSCDLLKPTIQGATNNQVVWLTAITAWNNASLTVRFNFSE